jgi:hypothetical protein
MDRKISLKLLKVVMREGTQNVVSFVELLFGSVCGAATASLHGLGPQTRIGLRREVPVQLPLVPNNPGQRPQRVKPTAIAEAGCWGALPHWLPLKKLVGSKGFHQPGL